MTTIPFVRQSKNVGQELVSPRGNVVAWIADPILGHLICRLLNEFLVNDDFLDAILAKEDFS